MPIPAAVVSLTREQKKNVVNLLEKYYAIQNQQYFIRDKLRRADLQYMREIDCTIEQHKARLANLKGDPTKYQNVVIPIVLPQVESAVTYQTSVFLQGYPIFGVVSTPEMSDAALMMDTLIGQQQDKGAWPQELIKIFRDGFKYNLMAAEVDWQVETSFDIGTSTTEAGQSNVTEVIWEGNKIKWMDLYNTFWDLRVKPSQVAQDGEFAGYTDMYSRIRLLRLFKQLGLAQVFQKEALASTSSGTATYGSYGTEGYYMPTLNPTAFMQPQLMTAFNWMQWAGMSDPKDRGMQVDGYQVTKFYARICPQDLGIKNVPGPDTPQIWKFIVVNNRVVIHAERMTNAHDLLPIVFGQPYDDGLGYQTKSLLDNVSPFQSLATAYANAGIAAQRKALSDRMIYDPSRISDSVINSDNPAAKMPVKPSAFGQDLKTAVLPIPFDNSQFALNNQAVSQMGQMANMVSGLNAARQGQFVKGNKTRAEFEEIMGNANGRDELVAICIENSFFSAIKQIIKSNILQYQGDTPVYNRETQQAVTVDPVALRKANLIFKISDGKTPSSQLIDMDSLTVAFQTIQSVPQIGAGYNIVPMFSYLMKSAGARIKAFEKPPEQQAYEQASQQWMQAVAAVAQQIQAIKDITPETVQQLMSSLPPQPTPEQFGWNPQQQYNTATDTGTILGQVTQMTTQGQQQPSAPAS